MAYGSFSGNPKTEWLSEPGEDRRMLLLEPFWFIDPDGRRWEAAKGSITDGASIPRTLWSSVGSPYTGEYRRAAIIHDISLQSAGIVRDDADSMFYFACMAGGCAFLDAKLLYAGVRVGTWASNALVFAQDTLSMAPPPPRLPGQQSASELAVRAKYTLIAGALQRSGENFEQIRALVDRQLAAP